jgi:hypothetical protein
MWIAGITRRPALTPNARRIESKPALKFPARAGDTIERGTPGCEAGGFFICTGDSLSVRLKPRTAAPQASKPQRRPPPPSTPSPRTTLSARSATNARAAPRATSTSGSSRRSQPTALPARSWRKLLRRRPHSQRRTSLAWPHASLAACHAGRVSIRFPPHPLQRKRRPASGTMIVPASTSTFTSAACPQASHLAITTLTPFCRMLANVIGGPTFLPRALAML